MEKKNYTLECKWVGEVNSENIKEMAKVMVWNCCVCTYKDDEVIATAIASFGMDGKPYHMNVIIDGEHYNYNLNSKRVSAKMGNEIVENILKAVAEHKEETKIKEIAESGMDKPDIMMKYESKEIYAKVLIHRNIKQYADAYGEDFTKEYARKRCESDTIETIMKSVPYATCPDWFGDYFDARYSEEISQG